MKKPIIQFHPSVTIAHCIEGRQRGKLLMAVYDEGYKMKAYVGSANPIGGNPSHAKGDRMPIDTLLREIKEEYDPEFQGPNHDALVSGQPVEWATPEDIQFVREALLKDIQPWRDFYVEFKQQIRNGDRLGDPKGSGLYSVFVSPISAETIECTQENIAQGKTLSNEGDVGIFSLDDLIKSEFGEFAIAHAATPMLNEYFGVNIPYPRELHVEQIGKPKFSFIDYQAGFEYSKQSPKPNKPSFHEVVFGRE